MRVPERICANVNSVSQYTVCLSAVLLGSVVEGHLRVTPFEPVPGSDAVLTFKVLFLRYFLSKFSALPRTNSRTAYCPPFCVFYDTPVLLTYTFLLIVVKIKVKSYIFCEQCRRPIVTRQWKPSRSLLPVELTYRSATTVETTRQCRCTPVPGTVGASTGRETRLPEPGLHLTIHRQHVQARTVCAEHEHFKCKSPGHGVETNKLLMCMTSSIWMLPLIAPNVQQSFSSVRSR